MTVKSENDSLKQDLGFDHSELLFLKLQLQALEVQKENYDHNNHVLLAEDFAQWKADWDSVDARLRSRRQKNRVTSADIKDFPNLETEAPDVPEDQGNWQLETRKHQHGRVKSITLKRVDESEAQIEEGALIDSHFDVPTSPVVKTVYSEQFTQTEEIPSEDYITQNEVSTPITQGTQTDSEPSFSKSEIKSQYTEPIEIVQTEEEVLDELEDENEEQDTETRLSSRQSPCCDKEHLCTACGEEFDYSSEDDEPNSKTPWQELCDGLVAFAGMQRE